jgi:hypothetical protein
MDTFVARNAGVSPRLQQSVYEFKVTVFASIEQRSVPLMISGIDLLRRVLRIQRLERRKVILRRQSQQLVHIHYRLRFCITSRLTFLILNQFPLDGSLRRFALVQPHHRFRILVHIIHCHCSKTVHRRFLCAS